MNRSKWPFSAGTGHIYLIGFSGSGKSTVGPLLARKLRMKFVDTDHVIETRTQRLIADIFASDGETSFRSIESTVIREVSSITRPTVISVGGGAFQIRGNRFQMAYHGTTVYLQTSQRELYRRLRQQKDRPLLAVKPKRGETLRRAQERRISELLKKRLPGYFKADFRVSTSHKTPLQVADRIARMVLQAHGTD